MIGQEFSKTSLRQLKKPFVMPKGVVCIKPDYRQLGRHPVYVRLLFSPAMHTLYKRQDKPQA
jgi:hypothetical protein